ncbi:Type 1 glutamine amidotransferase-like domain-containing protein [Actinopolymorpha pittospori]
MNGRVFLAGGGGPEDSQPLDVEFARAVGAGPLSYWPVAMEPDRHAECQAWIHQVFEPLGVRDIRMWTGEEELSLPDYRGIYIGGGNTYRLLSLVRRWGLLEPLRAYVAAGGVVLGGSAGAALLGADINTVAHLDRNDVKLAETGGADVAAGHGIFVHHRDSDLPREMVWAATYHRPVLALTERANVIVSGNAVTAVGPEPALVVTSGGRRKLAPGTTSYAGSPA